ncbi:MAG: LruC domain-containing protein [Bacteroidota bacterium]
MKIKHSILGLAILFVMSSCLETPEIDSPISNTSEIEKISIPEGFSFGMIYSQKITLAIQSPTGNPIQGIPVYMYDQPWYEGGVLLGTSISDEAGLVHGTYEISYGKKALFAYTPSGLAIRSQRIEIPSDGNRIEYDWGSTTAPSDGAAYRFAGPSSSNNSSSIECTEHSLTNDDFEIFDPSKATATWGSASQSKAYAFPESDVSGWETTASNNRIEIWESGHGGVISHSGNGHAEINAYSDAQLYQNLSTIPGSSVKWSIWHRGRSGVDTALVMIGPSGEELTVVTEMISGNREWVNYTGTYIVPQGQTSTRFGFESVGTASGNASIGNFIDLFEVEVCIDSDPATAVDADGDGLSDALDLYPNDPDAAFSDYIPGASAYATYAFEDKWPQKGDYDFNDLVLDYNCELIKNTENNISRIRFTYKVTTVGATYQLGFGLVLEDHNISNIQSVSGTNAPSIPTNVNGTESGNTKPTVIVFEDIHDYFGVSAGKLINSGETNVEEKDPLTIQVVITFKNAVDEVGTLNPFVFTQGLRGKEIHQKGFAPTDKADLTLFGTEDDASQGSATYQTDTGLPFVLNFPEAFSPPAERSEILDAYPGFNEWVISNGFSGKDWYKGSNANRQKLNPRSR